MQKSFFYDWRPPLSALFFLLLGFCAGRARGQGSGWIMRHPDMVRMSPLWKTDVSASHLFWIKWGEVEITYPPEMSAISAPACRWQDSDDNSVPQKTNESPTGMTLKVQRGHKIHVECKGFTLKSQAELIAEFPLGKDDKGRNVPNWCHEAPCIESIHLNGRD